MTKPLMTADETAEYLGVTKGQFLGAVMRGELPGAFIRSRPRRWAKVQVDQALSREPNPGGGDPIMRAIDEAFPAVHR